MKKKILIIFFALLLAVVILFVIAFKLNKSFGNDKNMITVFQVGVFKNEINALSAAKKYNGIVHKDGEYYRVYIAAYKSAEIINKMKKFYEDSNTEYYLRKIKIDEEYLITINKYEKLLENSNDSSIYPNLNVLLVSKLEEYI